MLDGCWRITAPSASHSDRLKAQRVQLHRALARVVERAIPAGAWKGDFPVSDAAWVPSEASQTIVAALPNGILAFYNLLNGVKAHAFVPTDLRLTTGASSTSVGGASSTVAGSSVWPPPTVAAQLQYGDLAAVTIGPQTSAGITAARGAATVAWVFQDAIATCIVDSSRREPAPERPQRVAALPGGMLPSAAHLALSGFFTTTATAQAGLQRMRLLAATVAEAETASSRLLLAVERVGAVPHPTGSTSSSSLPPPVSAATPSAVAPTFAPLLWPGGGANDAWGLLSGEVIFQQWIPYPAAATAASGTTTSRGAPPPSAKDTNTASGSLPQEPPLLLLGTSDGRLVLIKPAIGPSSTSSGSSPRGGSSSTHGASSVPFVVLDEVLLVQDAPLQHIDAQCVGSSAPTDTAAAQVDVVIGFVTTGNALHNATIEVTFPAAGGGQTTSHAGLKRPRPIDDSKGGRHLCLRPLTALCTDDHIVHCLRCVAVSGLPVFLAALSSGAIVALDGITLSPLHVQQYTRNRHSNPSRWLRLAVKETPLFVGIIDDENINVLRDRDRR